jgi:hypothetical protein
MLKTLFASIYDPTILKICLCHKPNIRKLHFMIFVPCKRILAFLLIDFFNYKLFNYFFAIDHAISFLASMRSYSNVGSILSNVALKVLSLATLGFINLKTCTKSGINTCQSYSLVICNVISFPTY